jgi:hypothetical protein
MTYQLPVSISTFACISRQCSVDLAVDVVDVGHAIHHAKDAGARVMGNDGRGLAVVGGQPSGYRLSIVVRSANELR